MINNFSVPVGGKRAQPDKTLEAAKYNSQKIQAVQKILRLVNQLAAFPWLEKKCSGDGETSFLICCKICAAFPEEMHKRFFAWIQRLLWKHRRFQTRIFHRHVEEEGHKHAQEFFSTKIENFEVMGLMDLYTNVVTPES